MVYWRKHGHEEFDGMWYYLRGPVSGSMVKSATYTIGKQRFCSFTEGWAGFCTANRLKLGDSVLFAKAGAVEFEVTKV